MASFYDVAVHFKTGKRAHGRGIGNNAAWVCTCGKVLLGPHEDMYAIPPCPGAGCGRTYRIRRGSRPHFVSLVEEIEPFSSV
jgi:hypothetical protein